MWFRGLICTCVVLLSAPVVPGAGPIEVRRAVPVVQTVPEGPVNANDLARFLAGFPPQDGGPLASLAASREWSSYANTMNERWRNFESGRLQPIRRWRASALAGIDPSTLFYPFSGPDFIYATTFFPGASRYILCGLEPVGEPPSAERLLPLSQTLGWMQTSFKTVLGAGYFVTKDMRVDFKSSPLQGTIPILCVMLARSGNRIVSIEHDTNHATIHFVRMLGGQSGTVEYYCVNLRDEGLGKGSLFARLIEQARPGAAYVKSASYLMHEADFSNIRELLLSHCPVIVQDDSGIPIRYFDPARWNVRLFGTYERPLDIFKQYYQPDMAELYGRTGAEPLGFGAGYHFSAKSANLIIATRK